MTFTLEQFDTYVRHLARLGPLFFRPIPHTWPQESQDRLADKRRGLSDAYRQFRDEELPKLKWVFNPETGRGLEWSPDLHGPLPPLPRELDPNEL